VSREAPQLIVGKTFFLVLMFRKLFTSPGLEAVVYAIFNLNRRTSRKGIVYLISKEIHGLGESGFKIK